MATAAASPPTTAPDRAATLTAAARTTFAGLLWGAAMLLVLAAWQWAKYRDDAPTLPVLLAVAGAAALGLALWQAGPLWLQRLDPDARANALAARRRPLGLAILAGAGLLLVLDLFLAFRLTPEFSFRWDNFGEAVGLLLFALIALYGGMSLLGPADDTASDLGGVRRRLPLLKVGLLLLGLALVGLFCYLVFYRKLGAEYTPEYFALLACSMLFLGAFFWLTVGADDLDAFHLRAFVLTVGGATGLILFLMTLGRAWVWREEIFLGGMTAWQGENAWRVWLVVYLQLAALALMFGSLSLARGDVRESAVLRRLLYGYNTVLSGLLVLEILIVLNVVLYALVPYTFDWSKGRGAYALSEASKNLLSGLKKETNVFVLLPTGHEVYPDVKQLMDNSQAQTNQLKVHMVSPDAQPNEYEKLSRLFPKILPDSRTARLEESGRGVLLVHGPLPKDEKHNTPYAFVPERKLYESKGGGFHAKEKPRRVFKGEGEVMKELNFLTRNQQKRKVYFLQGEGEPEIGAMEGMLRRDLRVDLGKLGFGLFADRLKKENYEVVGLSFAKPLQGEKVENLAYAKEGSDKKKEVPEDAYALVIAGTSQKISAEALEAVERHMDRGGRLMVFLDVVVESNFSGLQTSGIEAVVNRYGVKVGNEFALRRVRSRQDVPTILFATTPEKTESPLAKQFWGQFVILPNAARVVKPADTPGRYKAEPLLQLHPRMSVLGTPTMSYVETSVAALRDPVEHQADLEQSGEMNLRLRPEPVPVAVAVTEAETEKPRLVVFGDTEFITNAGLMRSQTAETNYALAVSALEWMAEREGFVGPRPKETSVYALAPSADPLRMILMPGWLMLMILLGLGTGIWLVRRR